jgi:hypothetical protein
MTDAAPPAARTRAVPSDGAQSVPRSQGGRSAVVQASYERLLGTDRPRDLAAVVGLVVVYAGLERATRSIAVVGADDLRRFSLVAAAAADRWWLVVMVAVAATAAVARSPRRMLATWSALEQGHALRLLAGAVVVVLAWQSSLYDENWLAGRTHTLDRCLVVVLAIAAIARPVFLVPFALVVRVVNEQFLVPFGTSAGRNIDDLLVMAVLVIAAGHLLFVVTGRNRTAPVVLLTTAALAAHFFIPGKGKLSLGWLSGDLANLPLSSYTAGWLGHTGGGWTDALAGFYDRFRWPVMAATLALELGAVIAVLHPRITRLWLVGPVVFHVMTFATTGFWFLPWIVLEVGLFVILTVPSLRSWVAQNATPARGLLAAACVVAAPVLFHPPGLAWLDAPVSYGYAIEGVGASGTAYHVPVSAFAPLSHHVAFDRIQLAATMPATGAYGAVTSSVEIAALESISDADELRAYEAALGEPTIVAASQQFMMTFLESTHRRGSSVWSRLGSPEHFWTSSSEPSYGFQEPLVELTVFRVRAIHHDGEPIRERELVLTLTMDAQGRAVLMEATSSG